jgi:hypothetical protein
MSIVRATDLLMSDEFATFVSEVESLTAKLASGIDRSLAARAAQTKRALKRKVALEMQVVDYACIFLLRLSMAVAQRRRDGRPVIWRDLVQDDGSRERTARVFESLIVSAFNALSVARRLAYAGFVSQSRATFRQFVELFDTACVFLGDRQFVEAFCAGVGEPDSYAVWKKWCRPVEIRRRRAALESRFFDDADILAHFREYSSGTYAWLSEATHVSPVSVMMSALQRNSRRTQFVSTLGGAPGPAVLGTLRVMSCYLCVSVGLFRKTLVDIQEWFHHSPHEDDVAVILISTLITDNMTEVVRRAWTAKRASESDGSSDGTA